MVEATGGMREGWAEGQGRPTCLVSFSRQPCSFTTEPGARSTTVRHKSMCFTDFSFVKAHSWNTAPGVRAAPRTWLWSDGAREGQGHAAEQRSQAPQPTQGRHVTSC